MIWIDRRTINDSFRTFRLRKGMRETSALCIDLEGIHRTPAASTNVERIHRTPAASTRVERINRT